MYRSFATQQAPCYWKLPQGPCVFEPSSAARQRNSDLFERRKQGQQRQTIVFWTKVFQSEPLFYSSCYRPDVGERHCDFVSTRADAAQSNLLIFHASDMKTCDIPTDRPRSQLWMYWSQEAPPSTPWIADRVWANLFNLSATYRLDSNVVFDYFNLPWKSMEQNGQLRKQNFFREGIPFSERNQDAAAVWVASNCQSQNGREVLSFGSITQLRRS